VDDLTKVAKKVAEITGAKNVLLKGGHIPWSNEKTKITDIKEQNENAFVTDILYSSINDSFKIYKSELINTENTHGTGCTLASTISANIAKGYSINESVYKAIRYVHGAIVSASNVTNDNSDKNGPLNHFFNIPSSALHTSGFTEGHFVDYLISHPTVAPIWDQYVNHPFVAKVADGSLARHKWVRYVSQDYPYLISYSKVHAAALNFAPDLKSITREIEILNEIKVELDHHTKRLAEQGVTDLDCLKFSKAGQAYSDYLFKVAADGDWLETIVALAPCLIGYYVAAVNAKEITTDNVTFREWIELYRGEGFKNAVDIDSLNLERHAAGISYEKSLKLVKIFADVTLLEVEFWNDALHYEEP
jgi:hydroxymethylpyrimidine/phosphomethylpyrimidine kinase